MLVVTAEGVDLGLELELRRIAGVAAARVTLAADGGIDVTAAVLGPTPGLRDAIMTVARSHSAGPVRLEMTELSPRLDEEPRRNVGRPARVQLVAVQSSPDGDEVEVHLTHAGRRSVGRSSQRPMIGAARATLAALRSLGADLPYEIEAISRLGAENSAPVLVVLRSERDGQDRMGVVRAGDDQLATARAVLHALNRHLEATLSEPASWEPLAS